MTAVDMALLGFLVAILSLLWFGCENVYLRRRLRVEARKAGALKAQVKRKRRW